FNTAIVYVAVLVRPDSIEVLLVRRLAVHAGFSLAFIVVLHFYSYHLLTSSFFNFTYKNPAFTDRECEKISKAFRKYIRKKFFSYLGMFATAPVWLFGVIYLFGVLGCGISRL
ncbi:MAG: hypothetical protein VB131_04415, partial [Burkholderia gladioli]